MTGSHDFDGDENFEDGPIALEDIPAFAAPPPPKQPLEGEAFPDRGLYVLAFAIHRLTGGQLDWGLPIPFAFQDGATFEFTRPDTDGL